MTHLRLFTCGLFASVTLLLLSAPMRAQDEDLSQFAPSDVYFQAWLTLREAEKAEKSGFFLDAFNKYDKAKKLFDTVALYHPDWKQDLVESRQKATTESMEAIRSQALEEQKRLEARTEGLVEEGIEGPSPPTADLPIPRLTEKQRREVGALQRQIKQYEAELLRTRNDRDANAARLRRALNELKLRRDQMARAPVAGQLRELNDRIVRTEQERNALAAALRLSRVEHQEAREELERLRGEAEQAKAKEAELENHLAVQKNATNRVVNGLRRQLADLQESLRERDRLLAAASVRTDQLDRQLKEARDEIADLREERSQLLQERDQMAALLKLNETERVQLLIEQNMQLGQELKEAQDRVRQIYADNNHTKDKLSFAKRDLAIAKARIMELREENEAQKTRLGDLEQRLEEAGKELDQQLAGEISNPKNREEMELLRGMVTRQLRVQERRRQTKELLLEEIRRRSELDPRLMAAIDLFANQELTLTPEESSLIQDYKVDQEFIFAKNVDPIARDRAEREMQTNVRVLDTLAKRAYSKGRFLVSRDAFESILEEKPGDVSALLNLGVVQLRVDQPDMAIRAFSDALLIRDNNLPFAHFMLGVAHYRMEDYPQAGHSLEKAVQQQPANAKAHVFLGNVCAMDEDTEKASQHWREAIRIDSTLTEPYYNLAVMELRDGRREEARRLYNEALRNGAEPNPTFERELGTTAAGS